MDTSKRRSGVKNGVVAGSVWERRMRSDEVKGGIRVFGVVEDDEYDTASDVPIAPISVTLRKSEVGKRRTWKSESIGGPVQIAREVNESSKSLDEQVKEMSVSGDGIKKKKSPILGVKEKRELGISQERKSRPEAKEVSESVLCAEKVVSAEMRKKNLEPFKDLCQSAHGGSEENCKEVGVCQERIISSTMSDVGQVKPAPNVLVHDCDLHFNHGNDDGDEEFFEDEGPEGHCIDEKAETEFEKRSFDIEKIHTLEQKSNKVASGERVDNHFSEKLKPICFDAVKQPPSMLNRNGVHRNTAYTPPSKPTSLWATKEPPAIPKSSIIHQNYAKHNILSDENRRSSEPQEGWQILVDLVMWKEAYKSALAFAIGTLLIISSSYAKHLHYSFISLVSYLSLIILAAIFLYKSITSRGYVDVAAMRCECEEEEAMQLVKLVLPCFNEFLFMLRAVLSGDPLTTMKLAVLLFVVAQCGSYMTVGMMVKLGFFGAFTIPKLCFTCSRHWTAHGKFWIQLFRDSWGVCPHKKAIAAAAFLIFWSFSSIVGRVWGVFFAYIAFRYHEQTAGDGSAGDCRGAEFVKSRFVGATTQRYRPTAVEQRKEKRAS